MGQTNDCSKTTFFGKANNYSRLEYPYQEFLPELKSIINSFTQKKSISLTTFNSSIKLRK